MHSRSHIARIAAFTLIVIVLGWTTVDTILVSARVPRGDGPGLFFLTSAAMLALAVFCRARLFLLLIVLAGSALLAVFSRAHWRQVSSVAGPDIGPLIALAIGVVTAIAVGLAASVVHAVRFLRDPATPVRRARQIQYAAIGVVAMAVIVYWTLSPAREQLGTLTGKVVDESGTGIPGADVRLFVREPADAAAVKARPDVFNPASVWTTGIGDFAVVNTDAAGAFRVDGLRAGAYVIAVTRPGDTAMLFPPLDGRKVTTLEIETSVPKDVTIPLRQPPGHVVSGVLAGSPTLRLRPAALDWFDSSSLHADRSPVRTTTVRGGGFFQFTGVPDGDYRIEAFVRSPIAGRNGSWWDQADVSVAGRDVHLGPLHLKLPRIVSGRIVSPRGSLEVYVRPLGPARGWGEWAPASIGAEGTFAVEAGGPGFYEIGLNGSALSISSVTVGGADFTFRPIVIGETNLTDVVIGLGGGSVVVRPVRDGRSAAATVVIWPALFASLSSAPPSPLVFRCVETEANARHVGGLPEGEYLAAAFATTTNTDALCRDGWASVRPAVSRAQRVTVRSGPEPSATVSVGVP